MLPRLKFWMEAKNRHGIHSKFVYDFLDKSLYKLSSNGCSPEQKLLLAAVLHFKPSSIGTSPSGRNLRAWLSEEGLTFQQGEVPYPFYITAIPDNHLEPLISNPAIWDEDAIIFVGGIRSNGQTYKTWKKLCAMPEIRVSLETFAAGLLCFRPKQAPQHFKIRLNSSIFRIG